jgi:hypothetical protein
MQKLYVYSVYHHGKNIDIPELSFKAPNELNASYDDDLQPYNLIGIIEVRDEKTK